MHNMDTTSDWEYVMRDFLEVKCSLKEREQEYLLDFLKTRSARSPSGSIPRSRWRIASSS